MHILRNMQDFSQRQATTWIKFETNQVKSQKQLYLLMYWNFIVAQNITGRRGVIFDRNAG